MVYYTATKNSLANSYKTLLPYIGALTALGTSNAIGTEVSGGSPAYGRVNGGWGSASSGVVTSAATVLNIPNGATIVGVALYDVASGAPTYYDQIGVTSQPFSSQGTYTVTATYTQT